MKRALLLMVLLLVASSAAGQTEWELSPYFGYQTGGKIRIFDSQLVDRTIGVDLARSGVFGVRVDLANRIRERYDLEFLLLHQASRYEESNLLFSETPAGEFPPGDATALDTELTSLLAGGVWNFNDLTRQQRIEGGWERYAVATGGLSYYSDSTVLPSTWMPTLSLGTGVRIFTAENFAFRLETRGFMSFPDGGRKAEAPITNRDCTGECIRTYRYPDYFLQVDVTVGFSFMLEGMPRVPLFRRD